MLQARLITQFCKLTDQQIRHVGRGEKQTFDCVVMQGVGMPTLSTRLSNGDLVRLSLAGGTAKLTARDRRPWQTPDILQGNHN
jgi:hypothetical protein